MESKQRSKDPLESFSEIILWIEFLNSEISSSLNPMLTLFSAIIVLIVSFASISINLASIPYLNLFALIISLTAIAWLISRVLDMQSDLKKIEKLQELQRDIVLSRLRDVEAIRKRYIEVIHKK